MRGSPSIIEGCSFACSERPYGFDSPPQKWAFAVGCDDATDAMPGYERFPQVHTWPSLSRAMLFRLPAATDVIGGRPGTRAKGRSFGGEPLASSSKLSAIVHSTARDFSVLG